MEKLIKTYVVYPQHFEQSFDMHIAYFPENGQFKASYISPNLKYKKFIGDTEEEAFSLMEHWIKYESEMGFDTKITEKPHKDETNTDF